MPEKEEWREHFRLAFHIDDHDAKAPRITSRTLPTQRDGIVRYVHLSGCDPSPYYTLFWKPDSQRLTCSLINYVAKQVTFAKLYFLGSYDGELVNRQLAG